MFKKIILSTVPMVLTACLASSIPGCGSSDGDTRPRQAISGEVTLDGSPLADAQITFDPTSKADGVPAFGKITDGQFSLDQTEGPPPGKYLVRIDAFDRSTAPATAVKKPGAVGRFDLPGPRSIIPSRYNSDSKLDAEVKADAPNTYKFELSSKVDKNASKNGQRGRRRGR
jgi:hypothetical protein